MPQSARPIPRVEPAEGVAEAEDPPVDPPAPFVWTRLPESEPGPGRLRPIRALIGDTLRFVLRDWRNVIVVSLPALVALVLVWLAYRWAYEPVFDDSRNTEYALRLTSASTLAFVLMGIGGYLFSTAVVHLVVQRQRDGTSSPGSAMRLAVRRLPRVVTVNLVYGVPVAIVFVGVSIWLVPIYLFERDLLGSLPWIYLAAGIVAYAAPQINVYLTAIKVEDRRPKFRRARQLVAGQRAATLGRVLLCQLVRVAFQAASVILVFRITSFAWFGFTAVVIVVTTTLLTSAFTLLYVDLAGVSAHEAAIDDGDTAVGGLEAGENEPAARPT